MSIYFLLHLLCATPVIIIDFDDTLFPTTHYLESSKQGLDADIPPSLIKAVDELLSVVSSLGEVVFLTASCPDTQWMLNLVDSLYTPVSAKIREKRIFYSRHHGSFHKLDSFKEIIELYGRERVYISVSDAPIDHFHFSIACLTNVACKAVQFVPRPSLAALIIQLECLADVISSLTVYHDPSFSAFSLEFPDDLAFAPCALVNI